jgi:hypothetical protein
VNRAVLLTALAVWVLISFVPQLAIPNLMGKGKRGGGGG